MADTTTTHHPHSTGGSLKPTADASVQVVTVPAHPQVAVIRLHGDIDLQVLPALQAGLSAALHRRAHLLVDLSDVHLIDCPCLGLFVRARRAAQQNSTVFALVAPPPLVRLSLHAVRLDAAFPTFTHLQQALATLAAAHDIAAKPPTGGCNHGRPGAHSHTYLRNGTRP